MCHIRVKGVLDLNFNLAAIDKIPNFHEIPQISHIHKTRNLLSITRKR